MKSHFAAATLGVALLAPVCHATPLPVANPGFEDLTGAASLFNEFSFGPWGGWELYDPQNITDLGDGPTFYIGTLTPFEPDPIGQPGVFANFPGGAAEGERVAIAFNFEGSGGLGEYGLEQTLTGTPLLPYRRYTLRVEIGNIDSATAMSGEFFPLGGFPGYRVALLAGGEEIADDDNTLAGSIPDGEFGSSEVTLVTGASHEQIDADLGVRLVNLNVVDPAFPDSDLEVDFDNVRLDVEPAVEGDFNFDGQVDTADYTVWRDAFTAGELTIDDYQAWRGNFGASFGAPASTRPAPTPEPAAAVMLTLAVLFGGSMLRLPPRENEGRLIAANLR